MHKNKIKYRLNEVAAVQIFLEAFDYRTKNALHAICITEKACKGRGNLHIEQFLAAPPVAKGWGDISRRCGVRRGSVWMRKGGGGAPERWSILPAHGARAPAALPGARLSLGRRERRVGGGEGTGIAIG